MRLLNIITLELEEFFGEEIPKYAILSHTWVDGEEVTFQEFQDQKKKAEEGGPNKSGWDKIQSTVQLARKDNHHHVWIDTCCIDKTSSAELTEAINSMMSWYEQSQVCYTYLADVPSGLDHREQEDAFRKSRWFTRGWTLQELLAPSKLIFIFSDWTKFGTRDEMAYLVSSITGIDIEFLHTLVGDENHNFSANGIMPSGRDSRERLDSASIAQRMSWASNRQTRRVEDIAYCLLGIFDINMPMLYGEGQKAFLRLQEQILMNSDDQSILAWNFEGFETKHVGENCEPWGREEHYKPSFAGLLATSPSAFSTCQSIRRINIGKPTPHSLITNKGLRLELPLDYSLDPTDNLCAFLQCKDKYAPASIVALPLRLTHEGFYVRARLPLKLVSHQFLLNSQPTELYALKHGDYTIPLETFNGCTVLIRNLPNNIGILCAWSECSDLGPYSQVILESNGREHMLTGGALLLGDPSSGKAQFVLVAVTGISLKTPLEAFGLIKVEDCWLERWDPLYPENQRQSHTDLDSDYLSRIVELAKLSSFDPLIRSGMHPTVDTSEGVYSTRVDLQNCFGKSVIFVDINLRPKRFNGIRTLSQQIPSWFRNHMKDHSGIKRVMLLLVLAPRVFAIVVEYFARRVPKTLKAASDPRYMFPLMTSYVFLTAGDPPRFLASAAARTRGGLTHWVVTSLLAYFSCKLIGSDTVLERFKKFLASKK